MSKFQLAVEGFTVPTIPKQPPELTRHDIASPHISSDCSPTDSLKVTLSLSCARPKSALYPATHLQLSFFYDGTGEVYLSRAIYQSDITVADCTDAAGLPCYELTVPGIELLRVKVNEGKTADAQVRAYVWKSEKLLGMWELGTIENLGFVGMKSFDLHYRRLEQWNKSK